MRKVYVVKKSLGIDILVETVKMLLVLIQVLVELLDTSVELLLKCI